MTRMPGSHPIPPPAEPDPAAPHDVLAAEEFPVGVGDPALHEEPVHDLLAAEEFPVGSRDASLARGPVEVPESPSVGGGPPREVLAADAFPVPAGRAARSFGPHTPSAGEPTRMRALAAMAAGVGLAVLVARRRR
jgi:hypothetical protein